jgi:O-antigen/teichoic acid export membrane protein
MDNTTESIKKNYIYNVFYQIVSLLIPLITTPYISRILGPDGVGVYSYTYSIAQIMILISNLGISIYGQIEVAKYRDDREKTSVVFYELVIIKLISTLLCALLNIFIAIYFSNYIKEQFIFTIMIIFNVFDFTWFFQGIEKFKNVVIRNMIVKLLILVLIFVLVRSKDDIWMYCFLIALSVSIGNISFLYPITKEIVHVNIKILHPSKRISDCIIYFFPTIAVSIYTIVDKIMLGLLTSGTIENGYYEQAHKIEQILIVFITSLNIIMRSRMTYLIEHNKTDEFKRRLNKSFHFIFMIAMPMTAGMLVIANNFVEIFLGEKFKNSIVLVRIFSLLFIIIGFSNCINTHILTPLRKQKRINIILGIGAIFNFITNLIVIPFYGAVGAACTSVTAEIIILTGYIYLARDYITSKQIYKIARIYLVPSILMAIIIWVINFLLDNIFIVLILQVIIGISIYFSFLIYIIKDYYTTEFIKNIFKKEEL